VDVHKVYPPPRLAAATIREAGRVRYEATTEGFARVALAHAGQRASAEVPVTSGWLSVDATDVRSLEGDIEFDLGRLALVESTDGLDAAVVNRWLEVDRSPLLRKAHFQVLSVTRVEEVGAKSRRQRRDEPTESDSDHRIVEVEARGTLDLHGFRALREAVLELDFEFQKSPGGSPESMTVSSKRPLRLGPSAFGVTVGSGEEALGKLLDSATVSVHARFLPRGR
jgi:hypothetical protein